MQWRQWWPIGVGNINLTKVHKLYFRMYDESIERWLEVGIVSFGASAGCEVND